jgi:hypothetical protein
VRGPAGPVPPQRRGIWRGRAPATRRRVVVESRKVCTGRFNTRCGGSRRHQAAWRDAATRGRWPEGSRALVGRWPGHGQHRVHPRADAGPRLQPVKAREFRWALSSGDRSAGGWLPVIEAGARGNSAGHQGGQPYSPLMRATVIYTDRKVSLEIGGVRFPALEKSSFETEIEAEDLPRLVVLDESAMGILKLLSQSQRTSRRGNYGGGPERPSTTAPKKPGKRRASPKGSSLWSGAPCFNPRWSNLLAEEVTGLGLDRIPAPLWSKVRNALKALEADAWKTLRAKWEPRLTTLATKDDDRALAAEWRAFLEATSEH